MEELALACLQLVAMFAATCAVRWNQCTSVYMNQCTTSKAKLGDFHGEL